LVFGGGELSLLRDYPDRDYGALRAAIGHHHGLDPAAVLPGNGAAELFTWAARDAAAAGLSLLPTPGFADYRRALACWSGSWRPLPLPLAWDAAFPQPFPGEGDGPAAAAPPAVLWVTNPHNPTGQLWSRSSLEPLLARFALVIVDEAFVITRLMLLFGQFNYGKRGILDMTHTRLFTFSSLKQLFEQSGFEIIYERGVPVPVGLIFKSKWFVNSLLWVNEVLIKISRGLFSYQIYMIIRPKPGLGYLLRRAYEHSATLK
jgi:hypothetical protein